jgi:long-chain acyl-CoA synthetase
LETFGIKDAIASVVFLEETHYLKTMNRREQFMTYQLEYIETIPALFAEAQKHNAGMVAFYTKKEGQWQGITYAEFRDVTENIAMGMEALGLKSGDRIAIQSENRPEWVITDFACAHFGIVSATIYPTLMEKQVEYILKDSGAKAVFASSK